MRSKVNRPRVLVGVAIVAVLGALAWFEGRGPDLGARTHEYAESLHLGDWGHVYDMAPRKVLRLEPWTREQFVTMMETLDPSGVFEHGSVEIKPVEGTLRSMKSFKFNVVLPSSNSAANVRTIDTAFFRDFDDWRPDIFYVPLQVSMALYPSKEARAAAILHACQAAKIDRIVRLTGPLTMEINRIPDFLAGRIPWEKLFRTASLQELQKDADAKLGQTGVG